MCAVYRTLSLLLRSGLSVSAASSGTTSGSASSGGSTAAGADVQEQVLDILALKSLFTYQFRVRNSSVFVYAHLGEQGRPDGLDLLDLCGLDEGLKLVGLFKLANVSAIANGTSGVVQ